MNALSPSADGIPSTLRHPRIDPFGMVHKSIRGLLAEVMVTLGATDFDDGAAAMRALRTLEEALHFCEKHLEHEETFWRPACQGRVGVGAFDDGHVVHGQLVAETRALMEAVERAAPERRAGAGRSLYQHFTAFVGETLLHMAEEERVLLPLLHRAFRDEEMLAVQERLLASMTPDELAFAACTSLRFASRTERRAVVGSLLARAPRPVVLRVLDAARSALSADVFSEITALVEVA